MAVLMWPSWLLFFSGAAALVYQVLWIKQLSLLLGVDIDAVTIGVAAFLGGLALGGWYFGRRADARARPWRYYAGLECAVFFAGVGATLALSSSAVPFTLLEQHVGALAWLLPLALVGLPAALIGGTLPALMRAVAPDAQRIGVTGGRLYAANTLGAIAGTLLAAFVLVPELGVIGSACAAGGLNLLVALAALVCDRRAVVRSIQEPVTPVPSPMNRARLARGLYAVAGGIALGYEVVWSQAVAQFISTRSFAFAIVLATYLVGLVLGSALIARRADRLRDPWGVFGLLIAGAGVVALLEFVLLGDWLQHWQSQISAMVFAATDNIVLATSARFAVAAASIVLLPTMLLGAAFPVLLRLAASADHIGRDVGSVVAWNTLGGILGTALAGFVLVPAFGLVNSLALLAVGAGMVGLVAVIGDDVRPLTRWGATGALAAALVIGAVAPSDRLAGLLAKSRGGELAFYEESRGATVAVVTQGRGDNRFNRLYIQGVSNSGDAMTSLRYMRLQALLPLIVHEGQPRSALVIGLGTGITAGALLAYPGLEKRVVAELLPAVVRAAPRFRGNYSVTADPRVDIRMRDGRRELLRSPQRYDLITLEPPPPPAAGVVNLYSTDFYRLAASRLQPKGILAQWLPLPTQNDEDTRSLVRSFLDVFPHVSLWTTELHEMLLLGSMQPMALDVPNIETNFNQPGVATALGEVGVASPAALMALWVTGREGLERYAAGSGAVTDDRPRIEHAAWVRREEFPRVLSTLLDLRSEPPLRNSTPEFETVMRQERSQLYRFYSAGLYAYEGDRDGWARDIQRVLVDDPHNPYYQWFIGGGNVRARKPAPDS